MTVIEITLPEVRAQEAKSAGLLCDQAIQTMLAEAVRRQSGRRLLEVARRVHDGIPLMSMDEMDTDLKAVWDERRGRKAAESHAAGAIDA